MVEIGVGYCMVRLGHGRGWVWYDCGRVLQGRGRVW